MSKIIYKSDLPVKMWTLGGEFTVHLSTVAIEYNFLFFKWRRIRQNIPLIPNPLYDGEYSSNRYMKTVAKSERGKAMLKL